MTKVTVAGLEQLQSHLEKPGQQSGSSQIDLLVKEAIPLTLQTKLVKARINAFELKSHLESHFLETRKNPGHYKFLLRNITWVNTRIASLNAASSLDVLDKVLSTCEIEIRPLTKQTPYTLLMMRVVEIGLPILLSLFSIFFVLHYSLTEKRSHEIKDLLNQRNLERSIEEGKDTVPVIEG